MAWPKPIAVLLAAAAAVGALFAFDGMDTPHSRGTYSVVADRQLTPHTHTYFLLAKDVGGHTLAKVRCTNGRPSHMIAFPKDRGDTEIGCPGAHAVPPLELDRDS